MTTVLLLIDVEGAVQLTLTDDGKWTAPGDPHSKLHGSLSGRYAFEPDDGTGVYSDSNEDIFKLHGFRFTTAAKDDSGTALDDKLHAGSWKVTMVS